jgi:hypothetical protein
LGGWQKAFPVPKPNQPQNEIFGVEPSMPLTVPESRKR